MMYFLLIVVGITQMLQIIIMLRLLWAIDKLDFSKEDRQVKENIERIREAQENLPPQN